MIFSEILKAQGLTAKQIKVITFEMYKNRIFLTKEEKIEERYRKMKCQRNDLKIKLELAEKTITNLDRISGNNDVLQLVLGIEEQLTKFEEAHPDLLPTASSYTELSGKRRCIQSGYRCRCFKQPVYL